MVGEQPDSDFAEHFLSRVVILTIVYSERLLKHNKVTDRMITKFSMSKKGSELGVIVISSRIPNRWHIATAQL